MKTEPIVDEGTCSAQASMLLLVGAVEDSNDCGPPAFGQIPWRTRRACGLTEALPLINQVLFPVVICERDLPDGNWRDVLEAASTRPHPPVLIVTSRLADDRLWAEVLNLGGYDVLAKPFIFTEVHRTIRLAWQHWQNGREVFCHSQPRK